MVSFVQVEILEIYIGEIIEYAFVHCTQIFFSCDLRMLSVMSGMPRG